MSTSIFSALQNGVTAINSLTQTVSEVFLRATTVSSGAPTAGAVTFSSSQAETFISVVTSSGYAGKVAVYPP